MSNSWEEMLKSCLAEMNKTYVDGNVERLSRFFVKPADFRNESKRWIREREQLQKRGAKPTAAKTRLSR
jgi:hypothetical protein